MSFAQYEALEGERLTLTQLAEEHNLALEIQHDEEAIERENVARRATQDALRKAGRRSRTADATAKRDAQANAARVQTKTLATTAVPAVPAAPQRPAAAIAPAQSRPSTTAAESESPQPASTSTNNALQALLNLRKPK
jgi:hypothetical protein